MDATLESVTGSVSHEELEAFLRGAALTLGGLWDADQIVDEVLPMAYHHINPGDMVHVLVALYPERRLFVRLDDERRQCTVQEWEYLAP